MMDQRSDQDLSRPTPLERGVWGILATPFTADDTVDVVSLRRQIELLAHCGARGVVALGVFGEGARLDADERRTVAHETLHVAHEHGLGTVIGLTTLDRDATIAQAQDAVRTATEVAGAAALEPGGPLRGLMVQGPSDAGDELVGHLAAIHTACGAGIVVQDYPNASGVRIAPEVLASAVAPLPFVVAVKAESTPTPPAVATLVRGCSAPVFGGLGGIALIDELAAGAAGAMTGFSFPEGLVATVDAFESGGVDAARDAWSPWLPLAVFEQQDGLALGIRKEVLRRRGILARSDARPPAKALPTLLEPLLAGHLADAERRLAGIDH
jgi:4-hydroxy-tetrahydrodipicolinate synthase